MTNKEYWSPEELAMQNALDSIREDYPEFWKEFEEFTEESEPSKTVDLPERREEITKPDLEKIRQRKFRRRLIVACFLGVCVLSTALAIFINSDTAHAVKFAMEKKYYQAKGWVQATDPDRVDDENVITIIITEEKQIPEYKVIWDELLFPGYMKEEYLFDELYIEKYVNGHIGATYKYSNGDNEIFIYLRNYSDKNYQMWIKTESVWNGQYRYNFWSDSTIEKNGIDIAMDNIMVSVFGHVEMDELVKIANELQ